MRVRARDTILGLAVLALVLAGVVATRGRRHAGTTTPEGAAENMMPDVTRADGTVDLGDARLTLSVSPRPPVAFARQHVRVRVESNGAPLALEDGRISFEMAMPMGDHQYVLAPEDDGWTTAEVVLPLCLLESQRWRALIEGTVAGRRRAVTFQLELAPPESGSLPRSQ